MLSGNLKKYLLPTLLVLAVIVSVFKPAADNINEVAKKIESRLLTVQGAFETVAENKLLLKEFRKNKRPSSPVQQLLDQGMLLYYFIGDSLVYWTGNSIQPPFPSGVDEGVSFIRLKNGWYQLSKQGGLHTNETLMGLIPVKYEYPFENRFLSNDFSLGIKVPGNLQLTVQNINGSVPVKDAQGKTLFNLYVSGDTREDEVNIFRLFAQLILVFLLFYYSGRIALLIVERKNFLSGFLLLLITAGSIRAVMLWLVLPDELSKLELFQPRYYASSIFNKSLGDLILNVLIIAWIVFFFFSNYRKKEYDSKPRTAVVLSGLAFIFIYTGLVLWIFKTLVVDSVISFEIYNVLSMDLFSLLGLICIALLFFIHYVFTNAVLASVVRTKLRTGVVVLACTAFGLLFAAFALNSEFHEAISYTAVWSILTVLLMYSFLQQSTLFTLRHIIIYVSVYSILSTFLIENLYERKERNSRKFFSGKLVSERDYVAEFTFNDVAERIIQDEFIAGSFSNPVLSQKQVSDRINVLYLGGYFNKYNFQHYAFDASGNSLHSADSLPLSYFQKLYASDTSRSSLLHYISDSALNYSYLSVLDFQRDSQHAGSLVLRLVPKIYYGQNVYPELLMGSNTRVSPNLHNYAYAIYQNNKLIAQYGNFPYSYYWNNDYRFGNENFVFIEEPDWEHSIQRFSNGKRVIVSVMREPLFEPVATFSYLFTFYFMVLAVIMALRLVTSKNSERAFYDDLIISFRTRINFSMLLMILFSFVVIGIITISFFSRQYDNFYTDRLLRKEKVIHASLEYFVQKNSTGDNLFGENNGSDLNFEIARLADINTVDINLFNRKGDLMISSQPVIYEKGILSRKMNPAAYFELENHKTAQVIEHEKAGKLTYLATYTPVRNKKGEAVAYLGIPYFERAKNINDEVSSFLVTLMNVYAFLLICAAILAYFISNSVTRPLTIISEKLRFLNLNKTNEPIEWNSKDEIGILVSEYNKMIKELEQSAWKLAKSERESAWREMAKQIAHEIKNPLTPMKLSIQYLQRAIDEGNPNIDQLARKVSKTLEEQIENLSSIASAFSSFAKMPKAQNEIINLNELLKSITDLFNREEKISLAFTTDSEAPLVFADKNQLVSVFNNLLKNAIQSIPENRKGFIDVHVKEEGEYIITTVSDNGSGIPRENHDKVFVPNFTTKSSGTGLGLAITKQIIEGTGGAIWFETAETVGTTFFVKLQKSGA